MGILSRFFDRDDGIGNVESVCPYCDAGLEKRPKRKKKCPYCGNFVYVRTRPSDRKKVLVTEDDAQKIDEEWMKANGTYEAKQEQMRFERRKHGLSGKYRHEASDLDVQWSLLNENLMTHAQDMNWGLYRNTKFEMAEQLRKEGREKQALTFFLEVSYLDANGPNNLGGLSNPVLLRESSPFDPELAFQAPAIVDTIHRLAKKLSVSQSELKELYIEVADRNHSNLRLPVSPQVAWESLLSELG